MILVDSSVWIDHLRAVKTPEVECLDSLLLVQREQLLVADLILCEVLRGVRSETMALEVEASLRRFDIVSVCDPDIAVTAASNYRFLRSRGITIRTAVDLIIGTFCIERGHTLLHSDRDFAPMERHLGLRAV